MEDEVWVRCPFCHEKQLLVVDPDTSGSFVQDCDVCCKPWQVPDHSLGSDFQNYARLGNRAHFIWGEADTTTPVWQGRALQRLVPGSTLTIIPRVGHIPYIEDPAAFNEALLHALAQNAR